MIFYTGVGSRETPDFILKQMEDLADMLRLLRCRSGGAPSADQAFDRGPKHNITIYLPQDGFENQYVKDSTVNRRYILTPFEPAYEKLLTVKGINGNMANLPQWMQGLHARNMHQVLGLHLDRPSKFLICYAQPTRTGVSGGTNTAWCAAKQFGVPAFNLYHRVDHYNLMQFIEREGLAA